MDQNSAWSIANQQYLVLLMNLVKKRLQQVAGLPAPPLADPEKGLRDIAAGMERPPAIEHLSSTLKLSTFEKELLILCAGMELDAGLGDLLPGMQGDTFSQPTFGLALATLPEAHWSAISPGNPLRYWRLIEISRSQLVTRSSIRIEEHILHYLAGIDALHEQLLEIGEFFISKGALVPSQQIQADLIIRAVENKKANSLSAVIHLYGPDHSDKPAIAAHAGDLLNFRLFRVSAHAVPVNIREMAELARLWSREAALNNYILFLDCMQVDQNDKSRLYSLARFIDSIEGVVIINSDQWTPDLQRRKIVLDIQKPTPAEQKVLWENVIGDQIDTRFAGLGKIVSQFNLSADTIRMAAREALNGSATANPPALAHTADTPDSASAQATAGRLWKACCDHTRPKTGELAQRIRPVATWEDIVLPDTQKNVLREIAAQVKQRNKVYDDWGFATKNSRGLGISALFSGESGTGKTMASEVLANELNLDLYKIDLSKVVNKYIGETEKNLKQIFDAAEDGGAILLFDEADALFGKRSDVKDSHDRYSNIEVSYLLQRMEAYRGLAILTTNMKSALDKAFMRRIRFVVQFPFPDLAQRSEIWNKVFPASTPKKDLEMDKLARLTIAGGSIQNIALNAAFFAADEDEPVRMSHIFRAARSEFEKIERPYTNL